MRNPAFCICDNKGADQLHGQRLYLRYIDKTIPLTPKYEVSSPQLSSVAVHPDLCRTWSQNPKTGFLMTRLVFNVLSRKQSFNHVSFTF